MRAHIVREFPDSRPVQTLRTIPLYEFTEADVDAYLCLLVAEEPDPIRRLMHLARKNLNQPYQIYLLGEAPYELTDPDPMYCLAQSDCVTFCEHMYAMAFAHDWPSFFSLLQRLRYKDGIVGILTRNHETAVQWNPNNAWLFEDTTRSLGAAKQSLIMTTLWQPHEFFKNFGILSHLPDVLWTDAYIPRDRLHLILSELRDGDFVNFIQNDDKYQIVTHVGMIGLGPRSEVHLIHATQPKSIEEPLLGYVQRHNSILGLKFLRLRNQAQALVNQEMKQTRIGSMTWHQESEGKSP